jgi:HEAT repeats
VGRLIRDARRVIGRLGGRRSADTGQAPATDRLPEAAPGVPPGTDGPIGAAGGDDPFTRAEAIGRLRGQPGAGPTLLRALRDDFPQVRRAAILALAGADDPMAIRALIDVVDHDPSAEVRAEAMEALAASLAGKADRREAGETG